MQQAVAARCTIASLRAPSERTVHAAQTGEGAITKPADRTIAAAYVRLSTTRFDLPSDTLSHSQDPDLLRRLLRAKDRIDAASHESWPVSRLARVSGVSQAHFARAFKQAFGVPPHRYLLTRRIERAIALLRDTELPITEIAFRTGWESLGTFGRTFRDVTGESPSANRERGRATAHDLGRMPHCIVAAAHRPALETAVSEKRRCQTRATKAPSK